jgi:thiamine-phosphate pyrophosphorylase
VRVHALVTDLAAAERAIAGGATVVQLRLKGASTDDVVDVGRTIRAPCAAAGVTFVVNDDVEAALRAGADGVHLGRDDPSAEQARAAGLLLGLSATGVDEAREAEARGAAYVGAGPVWETPSKPDAGPPIGLDGLEEICRAVGVPVVAIGGVDASNAADCVEAGAAGVAVIRAVSELREVRAAVDAAVART